jgi:hypothetical protein
MELSKEFHDLVCKLVYQKQDELSREQSQRRHTILEDSGSKGWKIPPGRVYGEFDDSSIFASGIGPTTACTGIFAPSSVELIVLSSSVELILSPTADQRILSATSTNPVVTI